ncbi:hypothetical protein M409DRAFT_24228 [Zasmidium cellare ATCC 36951]|uniref:Alpha/beta hydrolase fold-3 domain-containing protein n=1 Tax=Zasmidium cellare ATCC 36951 TaxID=1080233 RepID=A0A6A6CGS0_ZASCE|nr:uncharacterized protein M409DRAFT_24228 [Zasmidium cellare ATCC 36951]KAF2165378.1 hypothetical protein M409DRAFT_24228 [Zasmidium cellare ATCC 36951]
MLLDAETLRKTTEIHPEVLEFAKANPSPPMDWGDLKGFRERMDSFVLSEEGRAMLEPPEAGIIEETRTIPMRDGFQSTIKIHRPRHPPSAGSPLIVFFFGGGFITGSVDQGTPFARAWTRLFGATVVCPAYCLAPEHKFPTSQYDAWDSVAWLDSHATELGADPKLGFIVSGISAGGTCASAVATHAIEHQLTNPITGQFLNVPSLMNKEGCPEKYQPYFLANEQNKEDPISPTDALRIIAGYTGEDPASPWRFPVYTKAPLAQQPPAYIQVDGRDPLRDDGLIWEEMLKEAGVPTKIDLYPGCPHAHAAFMPGMDVSNKAVADQMVGVGWLLGRTVTAEQGLAAMRSLA